MFEKIVEVGSKMGKGSYKFIKRYTPEILAGFGIAGYVTTAVLAAKAAPVAQQKIEDARYSFKLVNKDTAAEETEIINNDISLIDKTKLVWKDYTPAVLTGIASTFCIVASVATGRRRTAMLASAYKLAEEGLKEYKVYREKTEETVGKKKAAEIDQKVVQDKIDKTTSDVKVINCINDHSIVSTTIPGNQLFYEPISNTYFYADPNGFRDVALSAMEEVMNGPEGYLGVDSWLCELGIGSFMPDDALSRWQLTGWCAINQGPLTIETKASKVHLFDSYVSCLVINYNIEPVPDYEYYDH